MTTLDQLELTAPLEDTAEQKAAVRHLTSGSLLARNTVWNLVGQLAPMAVAVIVIPRLIRALGTDRFGALTIAWMVVGYFSLFDLGLGRALTNLVAQKLATGDEEELPSLIWTANVLMLLMGIVGIAVFAGASPMVVHRILKVPPALQPEILKSFLMLSLSVPFVVSTTGFRGVLEAKQQFKIINAIRVPLGIVTFVAPLMVLPFSKSLVAIVLVLTLARAVFWGLHVIFVLRCIPALQHEFGFERVMLPKLLSFGGWMTVSNMISPIMMYLDRFLIGTILSLTAVAYYATPYEVSTKLLLVPGALVAVLFPAFSSALINDREHARELFVRAIKGTTIALLPVVLLTILFAREGLNIWLGSDFAKHSTGVLQWITLGVFLNGIAQISFVLVQGAGRSDITGKLHLFEMLPYLAAVWILTRKYGITGVAVAWCARVSLDCCCLYLFAARFVRQKPVTSRGYAVISVIALALLASLIADQLRLKIVLAFIIPAVCLMMIWKYGMTVEERAFIQTKVRPSP